eukprot:GDKI01004693.1.p2 GENE.GDKI01004693.1~~GDKI01004693.1.p2  ORF type:complete len:188 (-),score=60.10 GDKI01004693.1:272-835(-)
MRARALGACVFAALIAACNALVPDDSPAMKVMQCNSCRQVLEVLKLDVKYLIEGDMYWEPHILSERVRVSCQDPQLGINIEFKNACAKMMAQHHASIIKMIENRFTPGREEYEEDIVPRAMCVELGVCAPEHRTMSESISVESAKMKIKEQHEKEQETLKAWEEKVREARKHKPRDYEEDEEEEEDD